MSILDRILADLGTVLGLGALLGLSFCLGWLARNWIRQLHAQTGAMRPRPPARKERRP